MSKLALSSSRRGVIVVIATRCCCLLQIPTIVVPMATTNEGHRLYDTYIRERDGGERERERERDVDIT